MTRWRHKERINLYMAECRQEPSPAVFNGDALTGGQTIFNRVHFFQAHKATPLLFSPALLVTCTDLHSRLCQGPLHKRRWKRVAVCSWMTSPGPGIPGWTFPDFLVAQYIETIHIHKNIYKNVYQGVKVYLVCYISS